MVYNWSNWLRARLFPPRCRLCLAAGQPGLDLCAACRDELPWLDNTCRTCALPLPADSSGICARCLQTPTDLDACHALFAYRSPVDSWIQALKFNRDLSLAALLGTLLTQHRAIATPAEGQRPQVMAVPLHSKRLRQRGYNQAYELARPLFANGYKPASGRCRRQRHTAAQSTLDRLQRRRNLRGAFEVTGSLQGQRLLLVDDVITTGATLNELASVLKQAGADRVEAIAVARTIANV